MNKELRIELKRISDRLEGVERQYQDMSQRLARLEAQSAQYSPVDLSKGPTCENRDTLLDVSYPNSSEAESRYWFKWGI